MDSQIEKKYTITRWNLKSPFYTCLACLCTVEGTSGANPHTHGENMQTLGSWSEVKTFCANHRVTTTTLQLQYNYVTIYTLFTECTQTNSNGTNGGAETITKGSHKHTHTHLT